MHALFTLEGKIALVTGASRGLGRAMATALSQAGAHVVLVARDAGRLAEVAEGLIAQGGKATVLALDLCDEAAVRSGVREVGQRLGRIDILVNNAGIIRRGTIETMTEEDWDRVIAVNLKGTFNCCRAVIDPMKRQGCGNIVNVSSIAAKTGDITSAPGYGSAKAGGDALMKTLARQLAPCGIRVNAVAPHAIETEMSAQWPEEKRREIIASIPLGRLGRPEDVAEAVLFLASESASFITGEILDVNGGMLMD
jgi:3-oxoacyl-[acyl-carrier protein] reductase